MRKDISKIIWRKFMEFFQNLWIAWKAIACALTRAIMIRTSVF